MLHRTVLPPAASLDDALAQVQALLPKRAKLERYKPNQDEGYLLRREVLPDLSNFMPWRDEIQINDYEDLPSTPIDLTQSLFPAIGNHHFVSYCFPSGRWHGIRLGWRDKNSSVELSIYLDQGLTGDPVQALREMWCCLGLEHVISVDTSRADGYQIVSAALSLDCSGGTPLAGGLWINPTCITLTGLQDIDDRLRQAPFADCLGTRTRCMWCTASEYALLHAHQGEDRGPWQIFLYGRVKKGALAPTPMPIATCYLPKEQVVEVEFDETTRQAVLYSVFPLIIPTGSSEPVLAGGNSPLDPFVVDWTLLQQAWQQKPDMAALIQTIRSDDRCESFDDERWEPEPKAQVAAGDIVDQIAVHLEPVLRERLTRLSQTVWDGGVHDLCPEQLPEPCLAMSLSPDHVTRIAFALSKTDQAAIKNAFSRIDVDEEWWLGTAKDFLAYLATWLKFLNCAVKSQHGAVVIFYG